MKRTSASLVASVFLIACGAGRERQAPTAGAIRPENGGAAGYQHGLDRSRFDIGASRRSIDERGFLKFVGANGTFAVDAVNGAAAAIPNASRVAAAEEAQPTPLTPERHNEQVLAYFLSAGIPREQVAGIDALTLLAARGETRSPQSPQPMVIGYQSAVKRHVEGVTVADSVAWARVNERSEVLSEGLYWPAIPSGAIAEAKRFQQQLADTNSRQAFLTALPAGLPLGEVVIHHSPATAREAMQAVATYDVVAPVYAPGQSSAGGSQLPVSWVARHFDVAGREIRLPQEQHQLGPEDRGQKPSRQ